MTGGRHQLHGVTATGEQWSWYASDAVHQVEGYHVYTHRACIATAPFLSYPSERL